MKNKILEEYKSALEILDEKRVEYMYWIKRCEELQLKAHENSEIPDHLKRIPASDLSYHDVIWFPSEPGGGADFAVVSEYKDGIIYSDDVDGMFNDEFVLIEDIETQHKGEKKWQ